MTAAFYDDVVTVAPARTLTLVRDTDTMPAPALAPQAKARRQANAPQFGAGGDPLVDGAARLLSVPLRHVYAALWRVGILEVRA
ncbi:Rv1535 family protein [Mycobacterium sp. 94-17]|uniref:Rv1535 family protein n=1 Tax=Mycobacterium sp. 94-17 TaxID=2986147 RepID=UPI002D1F3395|nr:Rv1535 family protein [Mycobacterium sp. 94-17]MEB4212045.1 Rv1535 family protein [Mycobacterium sp. 94-17]